MGYDVAACGATQYRAGSGSDLVVYETLNYGPAQRIFDFVEKTNSLSNAIDPVATAPGSVLSVTVTTSYLRI